jgi:membrane associated rhomboid family serine protease
MAYGSGGFGLSHGLTPVVKRLLIANVAVFVASLLIGQDFFVEWFSFQPRNLLFRPWGFVTYMFVHGDLMHILVNMLVLFFFGPPLEAKWGGREFTRFYFISGMGGVALSFLFVPAAVVGASAGVYGVMLAFAMNWPKVPIYVWGIFPVQARWLVAFLFVVSLVSAAGGSGGSVAHFAHLGGLASAFIYLKLDWRPKQKIDQMKKSARVRRLAIVPRDEDEEESVRVTPVLSTRKDERRLLDAVDQVLDKISATGMASLTTEEKRLLDEVSRRRRTH